MRPLHFTKMTAYGNDYIYVVDLEKTLLSRDEVSRILSERNFSIGSDGLIVIESSDNADFFMRVYNPDGTEAQMCGNGLRSVGMLMYEKGIYRRNEMDIETVGGIKHVGLETEGGHVTNVTADIGVPRFDCADIPVAFHKERLVAENLKIEDRVFTATAVNLGNPHLVLFLDDVDEINLEKYGRAAENLDIFPERTNVEFCRFNSSKSARLRTWERGTGETAACATGCCACLCAGVLEGICDREITVHQNGGNTRVEWDDNGRLHMTAPSRIVFEGQIMLDEKYFGEGER